MAITRLSCAMQEESTETVPARAAAVLTWALYRGAALSHPTFGIMLHIIKSHYSLQKSCISSCKAFVEDLPWGKEGWGSLFLWSKTDIMANASQVLTDLLLS